MPDSKTKKTCSTCIWYINYECANPQMYANIDVYDVFTEERLEKFRLVPQDWFGCEFHCEIAEEELSTS